MMRFSTMSAVCILSGFMFIVVGCGKQVAPQTSPALPQTLSPAVSTTADPSAATHSLPAPSTAAGRPATAAGRPATAQEVALISDGTELYSPESDKLIQKSPTTPALVYGGRLYFFCCPTSMKRCEADPSLLQSAKSPNGYDLGKSTGTR
jgi:hypothetical protein